MELYLYSVEMPFSGVKLFYREMSSKEQIYVSKAHTMLPLDPEYTEDYGRALQKVVLQCVENKEDFYKLNIIEYILFLCKLRIVSIGEEIELQFQNPVEEETDQKKIKLTLNLSTLMRNLYNTTKDILTTEELQIDQLNIKFEWPLINSEHFFLKPNKDLLIDSVALYIKSFTLNDKTFHMKDFNTSQKLEMFEKFPIKYQSKIQDIVFNYIKLFSESNIFTDHLADYLNFNFYNSSYQSILRMFFTENLRNLYQQYYILASRKISPSYTDSMTIAERSIYYSFIESESEQQNSEEGEWSEEMNIDPTA